MNILKRIKYKITKNSYTPLNVIEINRSKFINNFNNIKEINSNKNIFPVLKSNAYGHGLKEISQILDNLNCKYLIVDSLYEAYELYKNKTKTPILISGYVIPENLKNKHLPFSYVVWDLEQVLLINKYQPHAKLHLFIDTGMNREGIKLDELNIFFKSINKQVLNQIIGVMSHFASSDKITDLQNLKQINQFNQAIKFINNLTTNILYTHISASNAMLRNTGLNYNSIRTGISLYGINTYIDKLNKIELIPSLELHTQIVQIKKVKYKEYIGYNTTFQADKNLLIGILPIGYNDGINSKLSNIGFVKIQNQFVSILGKISMNITTIDLTPIKNTIKVGDKVTIISNNDKDTNSIVNISQLIHVIPYEIMVNLNSSIYKRII